jgi:hypothetical protein
MACYQGYRTPVFLTLIIIFLHLSNSRVVESVCGTRQELVTSLSKMDGAPCIFSGEFEITEGVKDTTCP